MTENLRDAIEEARERNEPLSPAELREGWAGVEARVGKPRSVGVWVLGGAVTAMTALIVGFFAFRTPDVIDVARTQRPCAAVDGQHIATNDTCAEVQARIDSDEVQLARATVVERRAKNKLEVVRGRVRFSVTRRMTETDRLEVRVNGGTIIVVGTAFTVEQRDGSGKVALEHGTIRFVWDDHVQQELAPGESLVWPRPKAPEPEPEPAPAPQPEPERTPPDPAPIHPNKLRPPASDASVEQVMQRQFQLRAQRRYPEAMDVLKNAAADKTFTKSQRERFDYELGVLVQAHEPERACTHWKHHRDTFGASRADVRKALESCQ